jgi:flagellar hook-associated protein 1
MKGVERMSLNSIMNIATSGLYASQSGMRTVSSNVANVNTPGYVRLDHNQQARPLAGSTGGVEVGAVLRAADRFLQAASLAASSSAGGSSARFNYMDSLQAAFGDPTSESSIFGQLDRALGSFESAVTSPGSLTARRGAIADVQAFLSRLGQLGADVAAARSDADRRIGDEVTRVNSLLVDIAKLNGDIQRGSFGDGADESGARQRQSTLIDELATKMDIRLTTRSDGTTEVRTSDGVILAGYDHASLSFSPSGTGATTFNRIQIQYGSDPALRAFEPSLQSGVIRGLLDVRDKDLGDIAAGVGELGGKLADALNAAHNQNATIPAPLRASGVDTGLVLTDALGFAGKTTIAMIDAAGVITRKIDIDFDAGTLSVDGSTVSPLGPPLGVTIGTFQSALNTALGTMGTASFANGKLELVATPIPPATAPASGFAFSEPTSGSSVRGTKAFAHFFGLNDLVRSGTPTSFATGLSATDAHGFTPGSTLRFAMRAPNGETLLDREILVPGGTIGDLVSTLNNSASGLGLYGGFSLDAKGQMAWTPAPGQSSVRLEVLKDIGPRGDTSRSFGQVFGVSAQAREARATSLSVNPDIASDPRKLAFARADLTTLNVGQLGVGLADSRGAQALFDVTRQNFEFQGVTGTPGRAMSLADFASSLGGDVGTRAGQAERDQDSARAFATEAAARRSNVEGVNLDEELVKLTSYQQAYSAAARMIRAADEMYQALLNAV